MLTPKVNYRSFINQCILCNSKSNTLSGICLPCTKDLPWLKSCCEVCAIPLPSNSKAIVCAECQKKPPSYTKVTALFEYAFPIDRIIGQIKYDKKPQFIGHLALLAVEHVSITDSIDCLLPIPMHPLSQFKRGFNQAELLATEMARLLNIPIARHCLKKVINTPQQMSLPRASRIQNQKGVFQCNTTNFKSVLLIDDVMTTGATLEAASQCLEKSGVENIYAFVLARTER